MKNKFLFILFFLFFLNGCIAVTSTGLFGTGVSVALDPRTVGTQIDDSIMEKNLQTKARALLNYLMMKNMYMCVINI